VGHSKSPEQQSRSVKKLALLLARGNSALLKATSSLKCAWCGKPATKFLAKHPHCGKTHVRTEVGADLTAINYDRLRRAAWKVVHANEAMHVTGEVSPVAVACDRLRAILKGL
jgi:hypothetical protein